VDELRPELKHFAVTNGRRYALRRPFVAFALVSLACGPSDVPARDTATIASTGYVDSAMSLEEGLRRFREGLPVVTALAGGATNRDTLIVRFMRAVERGDTASIRAMVLTRAEFAHLYYPTSPYTRRPTKQVAGLAWFLILQESQKGISRVFNRYGGRASTYVSHACEPEPRTDAGFRYWDRCLVTVREGGASVERRLFGSVIERDGHFKFFSYSNDF
jgi:hypothetical protein